MNFRSNAKEPRMSMFFMGGVVVIINVLYMFSSNLDVTCRSAQDFYLLEDSTEDIVTHCL